MTSPAPLETLIPHHRDGGWILAAIAGAIVLHAAVFLVPLTVERPVLPVPPPARDPVVVWKTPIPPPTVAAPAPPTPRSTPLPVPLEIPEALPEALEPMRSTEAVDDVAVRDAPVALIPLGDPVPPPPAAIVDAGSPGVVSPERLPGAARPVYPPTARRAGIEGRVILEAVIDRDGRVRDLRVLAAPNPDLGFSRSAIEAVRSWTYRPGSSRGRPVPVRLRVIVRFEIED